MCKSTIMPSSISNFFKIFQSFLKLNCKFLKLIRKIMWYWLYLLWNMSLFRECNIIIDLTFHILKIQHDKFKEYLCYTLHDNIHILQYLSIHAKWWEDKKFDLHFTDNDTLWYDFQLHFTYLGKRIFLSMYNDLDI